MLTLMPLIQDWRTTFEECGQVPMISGPVSPNVGSVADNVGRRTAPVSVNLGRNAPLSRAQAPMISVQPGEGRHHNLSLFNLLSPQVGTIADTWFCVCAIAAATVAGWISGKQVTRPAQGP